MHSCWDIISVEKTLYYSGVKEGKQEGIEIGIEKGKKEEQLAIASKMKKESMPIALIAKITGLTEEEIEAV